MNKEAIIKQLQANQVNLSARDQAREIKLNKLKNVAAIAGDLDMLEADLYNAIRDKNDGQMVQEKQREELASIEKTIKNLEKQKAEAEDLIKKWGNTEKAANDTIANIESNAKQLMTKGDKLVADIAKSLADLGMNPATPEIKAYEAARQEYKLTQKEI